MARTLLVALLVLSVPAIAQKFEPYEGQPGKDVVWVPTRPALAEKMLDALRESGRFESLREDLRLREALDRVAAEVKRIPLAQAEAREATNDRGSVGGHAFNRAAARARRRSGRSRSSR